MVSNSNPPTSNADFDSGWMQWQPDFTLTHNLGTTELFVYVMYKNKDGLVQVNTLLIQWWALNEQTISVSSADLSTDEQFRILIWKLSDMFSNNINFSSGTIDPT